MAKSKIEKARETLDLNNRIQQMRVAWLNDVQSRYQKQTDLGMKAGSHGMSMAERSQKMRIEWARATVEIAEKRIGLIDRWIKTQMTNEQLINMRRARKEWNAELHRCKRQVRSLHKYNQKMTRWLEAMENLLWGDLCPSTAVSRAWRGFNCIVRELSRSDQRKILKIRIEAKHRDHENFCKPSAPNATIDSCPKKIKGFMQLADWCKKQRYNIADGCPAQDKLYEVMQAVDTSIAMQGAEYMARLEAARKELLAVRSGHWKKHNVSG